jgi:hypothetical protein
MPKYTPQNTDQYYRIYDANGLEWKDITEVDTDTGEIEQFDRNAKPLGAKIRRIIPTPISMIPIGPRAED